MELVGTGEGQNITKKQFEEIIKVRRDPFYFSQYIKVVNPIRGKVPFLLYPFQKRVLYYFLTQRFNIILKFRQAGITELISMYCLWLAMYHPNKNIVIISIKDRVAKKVLRKIKYMYKNLPTYLQVPIINGRRGEYGTSMEMEFSNGSVISSVPTTEDAGRSEAVSLLVIDEAAIVRWANQIWAASFPTLSTGGAAIVNSCVTGDTEIIGKHGPFRVDMIAPKEFGKHNVEALNLEVITHKGRWRKVLGAVNKGKLKTWEVENNRGQKLKATPAHKVLTTRGWKPLQEVIDKDLNCIFYDTGNKDILEPPRTYKPKDEILKPIKGFPKYRISNWGKVYYKKDGNWISKRLMTNKEGYKRVSLHHNGKKAKFQVAHLVVTHFIGNIPEGYIVDHIDCTRDNNHSNNLQIITRKENAKRANLYNRALNLATRIKTAGTDYEIVGYILEKAHLGTKKLQRKVLKRFGKSYDQSYFSRIINGHRNKSTYISKLKILREFEENIYDICVEEDESYLTKNHYINHNTPYGVGNWFHQQWVDALSGGNDFNPIRLKWDMHPDRDIEWYTQMADALGPRRTAQEIDGDFLTSGHSVFDLMDIKAIEDMLSTQPIVETRYNGQLRIFEKPKKGTFYYIGGDVATGRAQDYSAFSIMDRSGEEVGCFKGKISVDKFADLMMEYGYKYNNATLAPESNDVGLAVTSKIQASGYPNLYYSQKILRKRGKRNPDMEDIPGWLTTSKNRPIIIDELEEDIRNEEIFIRDPFFVQEAYTFIYDASNRAVALGKNKKSRGGEDEIDGQVYTDDAIMAKAITNHIRKGRQKGLIIPPQ